MERGGQKANGKEHDGVLRDRQIRVTLSELEAEGANVLVTGAVPREATLASCRQFFRGTEGGRRLLVCTHSRYPDFHEWLGTEPKGPAPGTAEVVHYVLPWRSASTQAHQPHPLVTRVTSERLSELGRTTSDLIHEYTRADGGRSGGDIRVCFDSMSALLAQYEMESVFRFVHMMTGQTLNVGGMGQFHVTERRDSEIVSLLEPLFDVVVNVRLSSGSYQACWHLRDRNVTSEWIDL